MDHALFLKYCDEKKTPSKPKLVYRGAETCIYCLPSLDEIVYLSKSDHLKGIKTIWTLPIVRNSGLEQAKRIITGIMEQLTSPKLVFNDIGLLFWFRSFFSISSIICGRYLSNILISDSNLLNELGICRIEFDDINELQMYEGKLPKSFHLPYRRLSVMPECIYYIYNKHPQKCNYLCRDYSLLNPLADNNIKNILVGGDVLYSMPKISNVDYLYNSVDRLIWHYT